MAEGLTHLTVNLCCGAAMSLAAITYMEQDFAKGIVIGSIISCAITPDLDLRRSLPRNILKGIPLMEQAWRPYSRVFKHRSFWTHSFVISSLIRMVYLTIVLLPILLVLCWFKIDYINITIALGIMLSWIINDLTHLLLDKKLW